MTEEAPVALSITVPP
jgi:hypothetical protein